MPELAEVETLKRYLSMHIIGKQIIQYEQSRDNIRYILSKDLRINSLAKIIAVNRRAKYLNITLDNNYELIVHLGMSGRFTLKPLEYQQKKHDHVIFKLDSNEYLIFNDARRFGMIYLHKKLDEGFHKLFDHLGPEPLTNEFTMHYLRKQLKNKTMPIKNALMDNRIVVGVGNIYASESLFLAGILPTRPSNILTELELKKLVLAVKEILNKAIKAGGTSLKDFVSGDNSPGYFKQELKVYARKGEKCYRCGGNISAFNLAGRNSFFCLNCQK